MNTAYCNSTEMSFEHLINLGFWRNGNSSFTSDKYRIDLGSTWSSVHVRRASRLTDSLAGQLGVPGLWKRITRGERCRLIADVPTAALREEFDPDSEDSGVSSLARLVEWLMQTSSGGSCPTWQPPALEEIESWLPPEKLTVIAGPYVRQGTLERTAGRLSIRIPLLPAIPPQMPESRWNWLRAGLIDAQNRHRAARIGIVGEPPEQSVVAEVDLSGAPAACLHTLFTPSLASLKHMVHWSIQTVGFLVDLNVDCHALEVRPHPSA